MPLDPKPLTPDQDPRLLDLQLDPDLGTSLYKILQPAAPAGEMLEVGFVYAIGSSRVDAVEHWLLYASVDDRATNANKRAYTWPSGAAQPVGLHFQFVREDYTLDPSRYKDQIEAGGVKVVYVKATCVPGR